MNKPSRGGLMHVLDATRYSMQGLRTAWNNETAFRIQCSLLLPLVPLAFWIARSGAQLALMLGSCVLVLMAEMFNSAIERIVDRIGTEHNSLSGQAKDLGSAGVFFTLVLIPIVWLPIVWERFAP